MSKIIVIDGNNNDKDNVKAIMVKGERGYSAYEVAVQNGYTGTEEEWVNSFINATNYYNKTEVEGLIEEEATTRNNADGELQDNIDAEVTARQNADDTLQSNINNETTLRTNADNNLQAMISGLTSGSPLVASSTSGMTDTTRIYVNSSDGYWYYYNGSSWVRGGIYQSTSIGEKEVGIKNLDDNIRKIILGEVGEYTLTQGHYIENDAEIGTSSSYSYTSPIELKKGETIFLKGIASGSVSVISEYINNSYIPLVIGQSASDYLSYIYTAPKDMYVVLSFKHASYEIYKSLSIYKIYEFINNLPPYFFNYLIPEYTLTQGQYIANDAEIGTSSSYSYTSPIELKKGETIFLKGIVSGNVSVISEYINNSYTPLIIGQSASDYLSYSYTALKDMYVVLSFKHTEKFEIYKYDIMKNLSEYILNEINNIKDEIDDIPIANQFTKITAIGDSITYSQVYTSNNNTSRQAYKTWVKVFSDLIGATFDNFSNGGDTASDAWSRWENSLTETSPSNLFIIYLGTNSGLTDTLSTDAPVLEPDYNNWADTNTGDYAKIVAKCQSLGGRVLLIKITSGPADRVATTNNVIDQIGQRFNVPVIGPVLELKDRLYHYYPNQQGYNDAHYNDMGYSALANVILKKINALSYDDKRKLIISQ